MTKFNKATVRPNATSPVTTETEPSTTTYEGAPAYLRDSKSELFMLAVANFVGENTFYEKVTDRDTRYRDLIRAVAVSDPQWIAGMLKWLRDTANMRSAPIVGACEAVHARLEANVTGEPTNRQIINSVILRADEPGELLAYWASKYGKNFPMPVKRGVADAMVRVGNEYNYTKYGLSGAKGFTFADVLNLTHPGSAQTLKAAWQHDLFGYAVRKPYQMDLSIPASLGMLTRRQALLDLQVADRRSVLDSPVLLRDAGITWEQLAGWLQGPMDADAWTAIIPTMGYMALLRNLRNFDVAGVSDEVAGWVAAKLGDPEQVTRSRQFPYRFLSAYQELSSLRWGPALDKALGLSLQNLPDMDGRSLVLIDTSASMSMTMSGKSKMTLMRTAAVFGVALGLKNDQTDVYGFANGTFHHKLPKGASVIREVDRFTSRAGEVGHGTRITEAIRARYDGHRRVFVITDEQTFATSRHVGVNNAVPYNIPIYAFNLGGYKQSMMPTGTGNRHELGGLTDATFKMIPLIEAGRSQTWPWL